LSIFEPGELNRFPLQHGDLESVGRKLQAVGEDMDEEALNRYLRSSDDDWWKNL
jgi:hypothetical protein